MSTGSLSAGSTGASGPAFAPASPEAFFPVAGAALLVLLLIGAVALVFWARYRRGAGWRGPWSAFQPGGAATAEVPRRLSSVRLDPAHHLHVVAWGSRQFLIATGVQVAPVVVATSAAADARHGAPSSPEASETSLRG